MSYVDSDGTLRRRNEARSAPATRKTCPACTFRNSPAATTRCEMCGGAFGGPAPARVPPPDRAPRALAMAALVALAAVAAATNPTHESLQNFLGRRSSSGGTGGLLAATLARLARGRTYERGLLWSRASSGGEAFLGIFGRWLPLSAPALPEPLRAAVDWARSSGLGAAVAARASAGGDVEVLAAVYGAVFLLWHLAPLRSRRLMHRHFTLSRPGTLGAGRWHTVLTSAVSHSDLLHLALNLGTLFSSGTAARDLLASTAASPSALSRDFWLLWLLGALGGSAASLAMNPDHFVSLGGSGALYGFLGFLAKRAHDAGGGSPVAVMVLGAQLTPVQALLAHAALAGAGARGVVSDGTDHAMHLGGAAAGALAFSPVRAALVASGWW